MILNIEDENFCTRDTVINISQPDSLYVISSKEPASCKFYSDGSINWQKTFHTRNIQDEEIKLLLENLNKDCGRLPTSSEGF